jgi:hypothetical protein
MNASYTDNKSALILNLDDVDLVKVQSQALFIRSHTGKKAHLVRINVENRVFTVLDDGLILIDYAIEIKNAQYKSGVVTGVTTQI